VPFPTWQPMAGSTELRRYELSAAVPMTVHVEVRASALGLFVSLSTHSHDVMQIGLEFLYVDLELRIERVHEY
jgi:hypothetical protein